MGKKIKKKKIKLDDLKVKSFVTSIENSNEIFGGTTSPITSPCCTYFGCAQTEVANTRNCLCPSQLSECCVPIYTFPVCSNGCTGPVECESRPPYCPTEPGSAGGCCFLEGTLVNTDYNKYETIENLEVGDTVLSFDENSKTIELSTVKNIFNAMQNEYCIINGIIKTTTSHPFYINGKWVEVKNIKIGDILTNNLLENIEVKSLDVIPCKINVYNLTVDKTQTFFVHNILVHNKRQTAVGPRCQGGIGNNN